MTVHQPQGHLPHRRRRRSARYVRGTSPGTLLRRRTEFPNARGHLLPAELASGPNIPAHTNTIQTGKMAGAPESVGFSPLLDAAGTEGRTSVPATSPEDVRVRCTSKRAVTEVLELCGRFVQQLGDALPEEIREPALRDVQWVRAQ